MPNFFILEFWGWDFVTNLTHRLGPPPPPAQNLPGWGHPPAQAQQGPLGGETGLGSRGGVVTAAGTEVRTCFNWWMFLWLWKLLSFL